MFRAKMQQLMYGRYGTDQLEVALMILYLGFYGVYVATHWMVFYALSIALLAWSLYRMFSRRLDRRRAENGKFMQIFGPALQRIRSCRARRRDKDHRYFRCPNCGQMLRVPRGKGRITVTCRSCGASFEEKC